MEKSNSANLKKIQVKLEGNKLIIVIDLSSELGAATNSGRNNPIATAESNFAVPGHGEIKVQIKIQIAAKPAQALG